MSRRISRKNRLKTALGFFKEASWEGVRVRFIISTGRTGTVFLTKFFRRFSPNIRARHEPAPDLLKTGVQYARGKVSQQKAVQAIKRNRLWVCDELNKNSKDIYIECNNRLFSLIPLLWDIFPDARIVHIVRDGRDYVRSVINRSHYTPLDGIYYCKNLRLQATDFPKNPYYHKWIDMNQLEKATWQWITKNNFIYETIKNDSRAIMVKFEDIFNKETNYAGLWDLIQFLDVGINKDSFENKSHKVMHQKRNVNKKNIFPRWPEWNQNQRKQFMNIAGEHMKLYGYDVSNFV